MMQILIVEDCEVTSAFLAEFIKQLGFTVVGIASNYSEAFALYRKHLPDLVFIDVHLEGEQDGIELAKKIRSISDTPFIFISSDANQEILQKAKSLDPYDFILKPFNKEQITISMELSAERYKQLRQQRNSILKQYLFLKRENNLLQKLSFDDILWIGVKSQYIEFHLEEGQIEQLTTLDAVLKKLPAQQFFRVHRSYVVNIKKIHSINRNFVLIGEQLIPVSEKKVKSLLKMIQIQGNLQ